MPSWMNVEDNDRVNSEIKKIIKESVDNNLKSININWGNPLNSPLQLIEGQNGSMPCFDLNSVANTFTFSSVRRKVEKPEVVKENDNEFFGLGSDNFLKDGQHLARSKAYADAEVVVVVNLKPEIARSAKIAKVDVKFSLIGLREVRALVIREGSDVSRVIIHSYQNSLEWRISNAEITPVAALVELERGCFSHDLIAAMPEIERENFERRDELKEKFAKAKLNLSENKNELNIVESQGQTYYFADEVVEGIKLVKEDLLESLHGDTFIGLRNQIETFFPKPKLSLVNIEGYENLVTENSMAGSYGAAMSYLDKLEKITDDDNLKITLTVDVNEGKKDFANFELWIKESDSPSFKMNVSGNTHALYKGDYYRYRITKTGYKPIEEDINLLDDKRSNLKCTMHESSSKEDALPCIRR